MPPDNSRGKAPPKPESPTPASASSIFGAASRHETPFRRSGRKTFLATFAHGIRVGSWNTKPISGFSPSRHSTEPAFGSPRPARIRSAVDLPQPEGPSSDKTRLR